MHLHPFHFNRIQSSRLLKDEKMAKMDVGVSGHFAHLWFRWLLGYFA
jgi:hypothetical protein